MAQRSKRRSPTSTSCRALAAALLLLGLVGAGERAAAESPEEQARALFHEANELYGRKMYLDALAKYRQARGLFPSYKIDLNIGGTLDAMGRRTEAAVYFERFLVQSAAAPSGVIAAARQRLEQIRSKLGRVRVTTVLDGATILADAVSVGTTPLDTPVYLEPGRHRLEARKQGARPASRVVEVAAGQEIAVDLSPDATASAPVSPAITAPVLVTQPDPQLVEKRRRKTLWAWSSLVAGSAFALVAVTLYGVGISQGNSADERYHQAPGNQTWAEVESAQSKVIAGHALIGVAAVGFGISLYEFLTRPSLEERPARLTLTPLAGGAALRGSF